MSCLQSGDKDDQCDGTKKEDCVAGDPHPFQSLHQVRLHKFAAASVPVTVFDRCGCLHQTDRQQAQQTHGRKADIQ